MAATICAIMLLTGVGGAYLIVLGVLLRELWQDLDYRNWSSFTSNLAILLAVLGLGGAFALQMFVHR